MSITSISRVKLLSVLSPRRIALRNSYVAGSWVTSHDDYEYRILGYLISYLKDFRDREAANSVRLFSMLHRRASDAAMSRNVESFRFLDDVVTYMSAVMSSFEDLAVDDRQVALPLAA